MLERALEFAGPVLDQKQRLNNFPLGPARKECGRCRSGFASLLARAERDPASDANTVSGLSSYAFTLSCM